MKLTFSDDTNFVSGFTDQGPFYQDATNFNGGGVICEFSDDIVDNCSMKTVREKALNFDQSSITVGTPNKGQLIF